MHWPVAQQPNSGLPESAEQLVSLDPVPLASTWQAREELQQAGRRCHLGVSNFSIRRLQELMPAVSTMPHVNQVERHPYLQQLPLLEYCQQQGILVPEYLPLGLRPPLVSKDYWKIPWLRRKQRPSLPALPRWCLPGAYSWAQA
jgi:alcohol dehydrogenase (NADP+)